MRVAIYARKSTEQGGADEARSVTRQVDHARAFAEAKGWTVLDEHIYVDDGVSGAEFAARPGFVRLMNALKPRAPFDALVMSEESRLGREAIETAYALKQLIQSGVHVWFYLEGRERTLESPTDKLLMSVTAFADELEREKARQRTYDAMLRKAKAGHVTGGRVFGFDNVEVCLADGSRSHVERRINEAEAAVVRAIFDRYAAGLGFRLIAKGLNEAGHPAPRAQQGRPAGWNASSVREALHRDLYRGVIVWGKTRKRNQWGQVRQTPSPDNRHEVEAPHLRIITDAQWCAVQARLATVRGRALRTRSGRLDGRPPGSSAKYLLSGLMRCGQCGAGMEARTRSHGGHRALFYGCSAYHQKGRTVCTNNLTLPAAAFEDTVLDAIEGAVLSPRVIEDAVGRAVAALQLAPQQPGGESRATTLQRLERELQSLAAAVASGGTLTPLLDAIREREAERARLQQLVHAEAYFDRLRDEAPDAIRVQLLTRLEDWRGLLRGQVTQAQQILRRLLTGPLMCSPQPSRCYRLTGMATLGRLVEGQLPVMVASPTGFEPVFQP